MLLLCLVVVVVVVVVAFVCCCRCGFCFRCCCCCCWCFRCCCLLFVLPFLFLLRFFTLRLRWIPHRRRRPIAKLHPAVTPVSGALFFFIFCCSGKRRLGRSTEICPGTRGRMLTRRLTKCEQPLRRGRRGSLDCCSILEVHWRSIPTVSWHSSTLPVYIGSYLFVARQRVVTRRLTIRKQALGPGRR